MVSLRTQTRAMWLATTALLIGAAADASEPPSGRPAVQADWKPASGPLATRWAKDVTPENAHREYPRPQMVRKAWQNLNGLWDYAITEKDAERPEQFDGKILVPFPIESALSGVMKSVGPDQRLWYRREFDVPSGWRGRVLLHFGAVDWAARVWVNGKSVGEHRGGYDPFRFDISDALQGRSRHEIVVAVSDPTDAGTQPRGKQIRKPHGIWYTPITGIWQTVWLEPVPQRSITGLRMVPDVDRSLLRLTVESTEPGEAIVVARDGDREVARAAGRTGAAIELPITQPKLWSPDSPFLYDLQVQLGDDSVDSYFGMRKIALGRDQRGITRIMLNNEFLFQYGPLDQGFWPDGLYTAPSDEALRYDIEVTKRLGFNMARKHVKVEPARWYYWCDTLGLLVWQDMPSGDKYIRASEPDIERSPESAAQFEREWSAIIAAFFNHPSIVMWVPFNEGWGQYDTARIAELTRTLDPTRLVNSVSGWADRGVGDMHDIHVYPGPGMPKLEADRAVVLGEFGGLGLPLEGHTWQAKDNWGYRSFQTRAELNTAFVQLIDRLRPLLHQGLSAAVYTQTSDVEIEVNGFMTYDRAVIKLNESRTVSAHRKLHLPPPRITTVVPSSRDEAQPWRYTTEKPSDRWMQPDFDDSAWQSGPGGFGEPSTPGSKVRTMWKTRDIWLRREIDVPASQPDGLRLLIHHDEDAEVYIDGLLVARGTGYTTEYVSISIDESIARQIKPGKHLLAVHCRQTGGGQYIDVGLVHAAEPANP